MNGKDTAMKNRAGGRAAVCLLALLLILCRLPAFAGAETGGAEGAADTAGQEETAVQEEAARAETSGEESSAAQEEVHLSVYDAALLMLEGKFGTDEESRVILAELGLDYWTVRHMANALAQGYGQVAQDVIDGKYGNNAARFRNLAQKGYDPRLVQQIVNGMLGILR